MLALSEPTLSAIHGPPGTGKTHVLGAILTVLVARGERPWALADSNAAVDHLALTAHRKGLRVVRIGHPERIAAAASQLSLDAHLARSPFAPAIEALERDIHRSTDHGERRRLVKEVQALRDQAQTHIFDGAQVIASTFGSLARRAADLPAPTTAVVDEATQATEAAVWVAVPHIQRLILAGDPEQLGPVTKVPGSVLERSLLQRVIDERMTSVPMLEVQHRMNHSLRRLVASTYGPSYTDHPSVAQQSVTELVPAPAAILEPAARWIDTAGAGFEEQIDPLSLSLLNRGEAGVVALVVEQLRAAGVSDEQMAILAPYSAQVALLRAKIPGIEVATVNAFQGREVEVLIVSWVRSNPDGQLGFVADARRLTVSLTRARRLLIQVGDSATLASHPRFTEVLDQIADADGLQSVFEPPWDAAL
jgi:ATP-dependent RNA/DNA helicase IGHMBP2